MCPTLRLDDVAGAEVAGDRARLGRRLHDHELAGHLTPRRSAAGPRPIRVTGAHSTHICRADAAGSAVGGVGRGDHRRPARRTPRTRTRRSPASRHRPPAGTPSGPRSSGPRRRRRPRPLSPASTTPTPTSRAAAPRTEPARPNPVPLRPTAVTAPDHASTTRIAATASDGRCQPTTSVATPVTVVYRAPTTAADSSEPPRHRQHQGRRGGRRDRRVPARQRVDDPVGEAEVRPVQHRLEHLGGEVGPRHQDGDLHRQSHPTAREGQRHRHDHHARDERHRDDVEHVGSRRPQPRRRPRPRRAGRRRPPGGPSPT